MLKNEVKLGRKPPRLDSARFGDWAEVIQSPHRADQSAWAAQSQKMPSMCWDSMTLAAEAFSGAKMASSCSN